MKIQLNVPFFSQRENNVIWDDKYDQKVAGFPLGAIQYRSCNITCLTMILHYYSIIDLTPDQLLELFWIFFCFFFHATSFLL